MGIYDRDYYRREGPSFLGSLTDQGRVTNWLIGINILCFIIQFVTLTPVMVQTEIGPLPTGKMHSAMEDWFVLDVDRVLHGEVWRLVSYAFLHDTGEGAPWHILFNMFLLFLFGRQIEDTIGSREYLWFYLLGAVVGAVAFIAASVVGLQSAGQCLGASGAVMAVLVLAALYNPRQVIYLFFVIPVPIWAAVVLMVALDAFKLLGNASRGVATSAHLGGAAFAFLYYRLHWRVSGWLGAFTSWRARSRRARPNLRIYREEHEPSTRKAPAVDRLLDDEHLEAQVDAILEKIQRVGMEGLSDQERQQLFRASEMMKRRRS